MSEALSASWCLVRAYEIARIDRLVMRARKQDGVWHEVKRPAVARALIRKGIELAQTRSFELGSRQNEPMSRIDFRLSASELEQLTTLQKRYQEEYPCTALPTLSSVQRALILLALEEVETQASFPSFACDVLASRWERARRKAT